MATKKDSNAATPASPLGDLTRLFEQFRLPMLDMQALAESQRKDMEAIAQASQQAYDGLQALVTRRDELLKESLGQWQEAMKAGGGTLLSDQTERLQKGVSKAVDDLRELAQIEAQTRSAIWTTVQDRMKQNLADLQKLMTPR